MNDKNRQELFPLATFATMVATLAVQGAAAKTEVPLFLFSGQSNMVGLGTNSSDLGAAQKAFFPDTNIKVYEDAEGATADMRKWLPLSPIFGGATAGQGFGPELFFGKVLSDSFPGRKFAFIKDARSGTYLGKTDQWIPPSSNNGTGGPYYVSMMGSIDDALKAFNSAFDTSRYTPKWAGFLWLQGEFDAMDATLSNSYQTNLDNLIKDIRTKTATADLPVVLPMIDAQSVWTNYAKIWAADVAMKTTLRNVDTVATKGLATNGIHYLSAGMVTIGERAAARWIKMKYLTTTALSQPEPPAAAIQARRSWIQAPRFDASGRRIGTMASAPVQQGAPTLVIDGNRHIEPVCSSPSR